MTESTRQFLIPDWKKILIAPILLGLTYLYVVNCSHGGVFTCEAYGLPMSYLRMFSGDFVFYPEYSILWLGLAVDIVFWYLVSCAIVFGLVRSRKRR